MTGTAMPGRGWASPVPSPSEEAPVIVAGMHRSGTTLVSQLLDRLGVDMGWRQESNAESRFFLRANEWMLHQAGASWFWPAGFRSALKSPEFASAMVREMARLCGSVWSREHFGLVRRVSRPWGFKDPRATVTWPVWQQVFPRCRVVLIRRDGMHVAESLVRRARSVAASGTSLTRDVAVGPRLARGRVRHGLTPRSIDQAVQIWAEYCELEDGIAAGHSQVLRLQYEDLVESPVTELARLVDFVGVTADAALIERVATAVRRPGASENQSHEVGDHVLTLLEKHGYGG